MPEKKLKNWFKFESDGRVDPMARQNTDNDPAPVEFSQLNQSSSTYDHPYDMINDRDIPKVAGETGIISSILGSFWLWWK